MLTTSVYAQVCTQIYVFLFLVATELQNKIQHYLNNCRHISQVFRPAGRGTYRRVHGEVVIIIRGWSLLLFIRAADVRCCVAWPSENATLIVTAVIMTPRICVMYALLRLILCSHLILFSLETISFILDDAVICDPRKLSGM